MNNNCPTEVINAYKKAKKENVKVVINNSTIKNEIERNKKEDKLKEKIRGKYSVFGEAEVERRLKPFNQHKFDLSPYCTIVMSGRYKLNKYTKKYTFNKELIRCEADVRKLTFFAIFHDYNKKKEYRGAIIHKNYPVYLEDNEDVKEWEIVKEDYASDYNYL